MLTSAPTPTRSSSDELVQAIARQVNCADDDERILSHLRTVFRVIRNRASFEQSLRFLEMLPMPFKITFLNDWHIVPHAPSLIRSLDEWADEVLRHEQLHPMQNRTEARRILLAIFAVLGKTIDRDTLHGSLGFVAPEVRIQLLKEQDQPERYQYADTCIWLS